MRRSIVVRSGIVLAANAFHVDTGARRAARTRQPRVALTARGAPCLQHRLACARSDLCPVGGRPRRWTRSPSRRWAGAGLRGPSRMESRAGVGKRVPFCSADAGSLLYSSKYRNWRDVGAGLFFASSVESRSVLACALGRRSYPLNEPTVFWGDCCSPQSARPFSACGSDGCEVGARTRDVRADRLFRAYAVVRPSAISRRNFAFARVCARPPSPYALVRGRVYYSGRLQQKTDKVSETWEEERQSRHAQRHRQNRGAARER